MHGPYPQSVRTYTPLFGGTANAGPRISDAVGQILPAISGPREPVPVARGAPAEDCVTFRESDTVRGTMPPVRRIRRQRPDFGAGTWGRARDERTG
ncbi:hypothetical protein GCM10027073_35490 [Streptomyces chlorus]